MSNSRYYEKFIKLTDMVEYFGVQLGQETSRVKEFINTIATNPTKPNDDESRAAKKAAKEE